MRTIRLFCALLLSPFIVTQNAVATSVGDFALLDHNGTFHQASYYSDHDAIVILVESSATLASERARTAVSNIESVEQSGKIKAFVISPNSGVERDALQAAVSALSTNLPVLIDETQLVSQSLDLSRYGEVVVINPKSLSVIYRGSTADLKGITDFSALSTSAASNTEPLGDSIEFRSSKAVSYVNDVAPILERNCVTCHRDGGIGPWSMSSHAMVQDGHR